LKSGEKMALSLSDCFSVPEYSTHILNLKRIGGEAGSEGPSQVEASQGVRKGKRKRVTSDCSDAATMVHVNAAILGTKSEVLDCLLKSEMQGDSSVPSVTLQSEEEVELMCLLLKFCYCEGAIDEVAAHIEKLLALLILADKFAVSACVQACVNILNKKSLKLEDASILLSLPDSLLQQKCLLPLIKTSRKTIEKELVNLDELFATEQYLSLPSTCCRLHWRAARRGCTQRTRCFVLCWVGWARIAMVHLRGKPR
jgi:hypothetical protein